MLLMYHGVCFLCSMESRFNYLCGIEISAGFSYHFIAEWGKVEAELNCVVCESVIQWGICAHGHDVDLPGSVLGA